jgi:hypothetical protein
MTTLLTDTQRLERFRTGVMIIGGCRHDDKGKLAENSGWISRAAEILDVSVSNLGNVLGKRRALTEAMEDKLDAAIRKWRDELPALVMTAALVAAGIDAERNAAREAARVAAELENDNDGPAPQI